MLAVVTAWHRLGYPDGLFSPDELRTVALARENRWLGAAPPAAFAWMSQDLHPAGAMGNAAAATPETGESAADHGARMFVELLREVDRFALDAPGSSAPSNRL